MATRPMLPNLLVHIASRPNFDNQDGVSNDGKKNPVLPYPKPIDVFLLLVGPLPGPGLNLE